MEIENQTITPEGTIEPRISISSPKF